jgi:hypothetical protein
MIRNQANPGTKRPAGPVRREWWLCSGTFANFLTHLLNSKGFTSEELIRVVDKPWHWTPDFKEWVDGDV